MTDKSGIKVATLLPLLPMVIIGAIAAPEKAHAYCADEDQTLEHNKGLYRFRPGRDRSGHRIPVYIITSGSRSVIDDAAKTSTSGLGLTKARIIEEVKATARAISETPANLRVYYAGEVDTSAATGSPIEAIVVGSQDGSFASSETSLKVSSGVYGSYVNLKAATSTYGWTTDPVTQRRTVQ